MKKFIGLAGLPRTGSTLLTAILSQNKDIHSEGISAVCQLMWDVQESCKHIVAQQLTATGRMSTIKDLVRAIPNTYYKDVTAPVVIDKCRSWTLPDNMAMLREYFDHAPKVIVLERPLIEIMKSFVSLRLNNNYQGDPETGLLDDWSEPIVRSLNGVKYAKQNNKGEYLFIKYDDLLNDAKAAVEKIYEFCELEPFEHNFDHIINKHPEIDEVYGGLGMHEVRPIISKREINVTLSDEAIKKCNYLEQ